MKKIITVVMIMFGVLSQAQIKKGAIISIYGNKNLSDSPLETKLYEALLNDDSFDVSKTVNKFEEIIAKKIIPAFPFEFKPKSEIVSSEEYQAIRSNLVEDVQEDESNLKKFFQAIIPAEGYRNIYAFALLKDKKAIAKCFEIFPDVDAVMVAFIDYNVYDGIGFGGLSKKKVYANMNIKVFNKAGKRIFKLKESASSKKGVLAVGGYVTDPAKLKPMIDQATNALFKEMESSIAKSMKKLAKKMSKMK